MTTTGTNFEIARRNMVEYQIRCCKVLDADVLELIESMPREEFLPAELRSLAYMEGHVPLPDGQEMLSPLQEATILQALRLTGEERVLEIGTGTGFLTAMLAMSAAEVVSVELHDSLAGLARKNLDHHGVDNATVVCANAMDPDELKRHEEIRPPFDTLVVGAAVDEIPEHLERLIGEQGEMIAFVGTNPVVELIHYTRETPTWLETRLMETLLQDVEAVPEKRRLVF